MATKARDPAPDAYLAQAIARYPATVADTATHALRRLRARFPGARVFVYDRRQSLPIGFAAASGGAALFSVVLYPRWVRFFFLEGAALDDPKGRLEGAGNQVRSILIDGEAEALDDAYIRKLMGQALKLAEADLTTVLARLSSSRSFRRHRVRPSQPNPHRDASHAHPARDLAAETNQWSD